MQNFKYFVDIVLKNRIFAASYSDMNDPMEGYFLHNLGDNSSNLISAFRGKKSSLKICSLSRKNNDPLMWSHYADCHRGVAIGLSVDRTKYDVRQIKYTGLSHINDVDVIHLADTAKNILCHKHICWEYEEEERILIDDGSEFADVKVIDVLLGSRMKLDDKEFIKELLLNINPKIRVRDSEIIDIY